MEPNNVCICCHESIMADEVNFSPAIMLRHNFSKLEVIAVFQDLERAVEVAKEFAKSVNLPLTVSYKYMNRSECFGIKPWQGDRVKAMKDQQFKELMDSTPELNEKYFRAYKTGMMKRYRIRNSTNTPEEDRLFNAKGVELIGYLDGLQGTKPRSYCIKNDNDCYTCSLANYGFDCKNNAVPFVNKEGSVQNAGRY